MKADSSAADAASASAAVAAAEAARPAVPAPEPLTPQRMEEENRRSDLFIMAGVMLVAFLLGFFKIAGSDLWLHLKSGWWIHQNGVPKTDPFSYASQDPVAKTKRQWVNLHWLYDLGLYQAELVETKWRVRRLADEYARLLEKRLAPKYDDQMKNITPPLPEEESSELDQALAGVRAAASTSDTQQMRVAAERLVAAAKAAELELAQPTLGVDPAGDYPEIARYSGPSGGAFVNLGALVLAKSLLLVVMAALLLGVRHPGPTRWWTAVAVTAALVAMSDLVFLGPEIVSVVLLAAVFWSLHQFQIGQEWAVWLLIPLEALWVNIDGLFVLGIAVGAIFLACEALSRLLGADTRPAGVPPALGRLGQIALAVSLSVVATLANPFGFRAWSVPGDLIRELFSGGYGLEALRSSVDLLRTKPFWSAVASTPPALVAAVLIALALVSFAVNWQGFSWWRMLTLVLFLVMLGVTVRNLALASLAAGVTLALNGQEWFLRRFGTEARITGVWPIWSRGGRVATLLVITAVCVLRGTRSLGNVETSNFGSGIQWAAVDLETGKFLRQAKLQGQAFNTVPAQGNLLIWSNYPPTKVFLDGRLALQRDVRGEFDNLRLALKAWNDDQATETEQVLDKYNISHVILNLSRLGGTTFYNTFGALRRSERWKLVHWDGSSAVFGRCDLPDDHPLAADARWFQSHAFDPAKLVFAQNDEKLPDPPAPVTPPSFIDKWWHTRRALSTQANLDFHLLDPDLCPSTLPDDFLPPPEYCYLAIRAARRTLAKQQVSPQSYGVLADAYFYLLRHEMPQAETPEILEFRMIQCLSALNQLVAAKPDHVLAQRQLADWYGKQGHYDLANQHYEALIELLPESDFRAEFVRRSHQLTMEIDRVRNELEQYGSRLPTPAARADFLVSRGFPGLAIEQLTQSAAMVLPTLETGPTLAKLYIRTGQAGDPERGAEFEMRNLQDEMRRQNLLAPPGLRPGFWEEMWATVKLMQGDYKSARAFLEDAIAKTRHAMARDLLAVASGEILQGSVTPMISMAVTLSDDAERQVRLEFELGMLQLEAGEPMEAVRHFKQALAVREDTAYRPVIGFYLEKITGEKLEPLPEPAMEEMDERPGTRPAVLPLRPAELPPRPAPPEGTEPPDKAPDPVPMPGTKKSETTERADPRPRSEEKPEK